MAFSDHQKAERVFKSHSKTSLENGIRAMAAWVKVHGARESSIFKDIEIIKNMPQNWRAAMNLPEK